MKLAPPVHLKPLLDAYIAESGLAVTFTTMRAQALIDLHDRGMTGDDVAAVMRELKKLVARGERGYTDIALSFRSAIEDVDRFEDRALRLRKREEYRRRLAVARAGRRPVPQTRSLPDGSTVTVYGPPEDKDVSPIGDKVNEIVEDSRRHLQELREKLRGGQ